MRAKHSPSHKEHDVSASTISKHATFKQSLLIILAVFSLTGLVGFGGYAVIQNLGALAEEISEEEPSEFEESFLEEEEFILEEETEIVEEEVETPSTTPPPATLQASAAIAANDAKKIAELIKKAFLDTVPHVSE